MEALFMPAILFAIIFLIYWGQLFLMSKLAPRITNHPEGKFKAYACGEDMKENRVNPDYAQFFPFAFFFTIMHVVALIVATAPRLLQTTSFIIAVLFLVSATISLFVLLRKEGE
ncbi:MAG: NADH-quinone oxidoreductase subunit A [Deltaproteobacteria bacterium]|jgi:NADH-quinone oxidoreductase subunit A